VGPSGRCCMVWNSLSRTRSCIERVPILCMSHASILDSYPSIPCYRSITQVATPWWWLLESDGSSLGDAIVGSMSSEVLVVVAHLLLGIVPPPTVLNLEFLSNKLQVSWGLGFS
jgi:hypothetical protein